MDFSHLKKLEVKDKTAEYSIDQIEGEPTFVMKPATEANKPYFNALLKQSRKKVRAVQVGSVNSKLIKENRAEDRELFPKYVIVDWKNVTDNKGKKSPFTEENCAQYLEALPDWSFDLVRAFASTSENFAGYASIDIEEKAKN